MPRGHPKNTIMSKIKITAISMATAFAVLLFAGQARADFYVYPTIQITNNPVQSNTLTIGTNVLTWLTNITNTASQVCLTNTTGGNATNLFNELGSFGISNVTVVGLSNSTYVTMRSALNSNLTVTLVGTYGRVTYYTSAVFAAQTAAFPFTKESLASRQGYMSAVVTGINAYATTKFDRAALPLSYYIDDTTAQVMSNKTAVNLRITTGTVAKASVTNIWVPSTNLSGAAPGKLRFVTANNDPEGSAYYDIHPMSYQFPYPSISDGASNFFDIVDFAAEGFETNRNIMTLGATWRWFPKLDTVPFYGFSFTNLWGTSQIFSNQWGSDVFARFDMPVKLTSTGTFTGPMFFSGPVASSGTFSNNGTIRGGVIAGALIQDAALNNGTNTGALLIGSRTAGSLSLGSDLSLGSTNFTSLANGNNIALDFGSNVFIHITGSVSADAAICGITKGRESKWHRLYNDQPFTIYLAQNTSDPQPTNRFGFKWTTGDIGIPAYGWADILYDVSALRWVATDVFPYAALATNTISFVNSIYVDPTNGLDSTGLRGRLDRPFQTVTGALAVALAGDTIYGASAEYNAGTNNWLRKGVNYNFAGATVIWTNTYLANSQTFQGLFDDRLTGPTTNYIIGGKFVYWATGGLLIKGMVVQTNALSEMHFTANRVEGSCEVGQLPPQLGGANAFLHFEGGKYFVDVPEIEDTGRFTWGLDEFSSPAVTNGPAITGIYWEQGEGHLNVRKLSVFQGYGVWGHEPTNTSSSDFHYNGDLITVVSNGGAGLYIDSSASVASPNYRSWWRVNELKAPNSLGLSLIGLNKVYWELAGKISAATAIASSSVLWLNAQKVTGLPQAATISGGEHHLNVQQWEQGSGSLGVFISIAAGNNHFNGGWAKVTNASGPLVRVSGGTNLIQGMLLQTTGAGSSAHPIDVATNNLTLQDVALISGSTNSIFATNAQTVTVRGSMTVISNINSLVTIAGLRSQDGKLYGDGSGLTNTPVAVTTTNTLLNTNSLLAGNGVVLTNSGVAGITIATKPNFFMPSFAQSRASWIINNGSSASFTALGDVATINFSGQTAVAGPDAASGAGVFLHTSSLQFNINGVSGNANYRMGRNCYASTRAMLTNQSSVIFWFVLTDQTITTQMTNAPAGGNYGGFRMSTTAPDSTYKFITANGGTQTITDTLVTTNGTDKSFEIYFDDSVSKAYGVIDGVVVATNSANLPASGTSMRYVNAIMGLGSGITNAIKVPYVFATSTK
jgi:hypothetical protein